MSPRFMLDTNIVSQFLRGHGVLTTRIVRVPMTQLCISAVTRGELLFGLARRPEATRLTRTVSEFLRRIDTLPWDAEIAATYGAVRAKMQAQGRSLEPLDLLIAAHAIGLDAVLVSNDAAFIHVPDLVMQDWTAA